MINAEDILLTIRGMDQTPMGLIVLTQIRNKIQGKADDVLVKSNCGLNWDESKKC